MDRLPVVNASFEDTCILCGAEIHKLDQPILTICDNCHNKKNIHYRCDDDHFICIDCIEIPVEDYVKSICLNYSGKDPLELVVKIMNTPAVRMHGAEHHFIVPAVLQTCVHNAINSTDSLDLKLETLMARAKLDTPSSCAFTKEFCGAAQGAGIFLSYHLNRDSGTEELDGLTDTLTANAIKAIIDHGGPRCCKRDAYLTIQTAVDYISDKLAISLDRSEAKCTFSLRNKSCGHEECTFYNLSLNLV